MTEIAKVLSAIADDLAVIPANIERDRLRTIVRTLDGVSSYDHYRAVAAGLGIQEDEGET